MTNPPSLGSMKRRNIRWIPYIHIWNWKCIFHRNIVTRFSKISVLLELYCITDKFCCKLEYPENSPIAFNFIRGLNFWNLILWKLGTVLHVLQEKRLDVNHLDPHSAWKKIGPVCSVALLLFNQTRYTDSYFHLASSFL